MTDIRKELRRSLASIPEAASFGDSIRNEIVSALNKLNPQSIGIYYPLARWKEPSLLFLENLFAGRCAFPCVTGSGASEMKYYFAKSSNLVTSREIPDLREPVPTPSAEVVPEIIFAPATACDRLGHRLGKGGGYYDRYFNSHPECLAIGVVDDRCLYSTFPAEWIQIHDHPMAFILTQTQYFKTKENHS